ncbi:MAG: DUF2079 domain-containing protein [Candidatus Bathyarchaeum sp.]|nr:MAG: DUF2079 domain-containing protein [Candidatus Bathyarchaeum sp.]
MVDKIMLLKGRMDIRRIKTIIRSDYFILFLIAFFYVLVVSSVAISRHHDFRTNAWDLGIYSQSLYTTLNHGKILYYTAELAGNPSGSLFGIHFSPFLFLLVPIYAIFQNPVTLLILRPIAISIGLIPLHWILREQQLNSRLVTFFLAIVYVVYPPINAPLSNFDVEAFLPALFLFAIYYLRKGKLSYSYVFIVLSLMVNEFVPFIVIAMAVYFFILHRREIIDGLRSRRLTRNATFAIILLFTGILWFSLAGAVITRFNPNALNTKWEWGEFGTSPGEIVTNVVANPAKTINVLFNDGQSKFLYITSLFGPLAFLSFLDPLTLLMTCPWIMASLLSINPLYYAIGTQYPAFVSPFIFVAAVNGIKKLGNITSRDVLRTIGFLMAVSLVISILLLPTGGDYSVTKAEPTIRLALSEIPAIASVSVMPEVHPHLCKRLEVYPYFKSGVDYVLVNIYSWWYTVTLPRPAHVAPRWCDAEIGEEYGIVVNANGILLYKNGYNGSLEHYEGVDFTYTYQNTRIATGNLVLDDVVLGDSVTTTDVFVHRVTDATPLFFEVPEKVLPPGRYNVTVWMKVSSIPDGEVITIEALKEPEDSVIVTKKIMGSDFTEVGRWQSFTFNLAIEQPTFIEFDAYVTNSTDVYYYAMNVLQVSGGV